MTLQKLLNIKYPIIQGAMASITNGAFAAAVSNCGAMGIIASGGMPSEALREEIRTCKKLTDKPFGVNIMLMNPDADAMADMVIEEGVTFITTGAGNPGKYMEKWKENGIKVFPVVSAGVLAQRMEKLGADGIIAEGCEAGGHIGESTTMAVLPQIVNSVSIPVVGAGGIASGKQMLAAEVLGAVGVQIGTCLLVADECPIHQNYKDALIRAKDHDTTVTGRINGSPVRIIKNKMAKEYIKLEKQGANLEELEQYTLGSLRKAVISGDVKEGSVMAGQVAGMLNNTKPLATIFEELMADYNNAIEEIKNK